MISTGEKVPSVIIKQANPEGGGSDVDPATLFAGKKVVMFSLPGAFRPTCSAKHLTGYLEKVSEIKASGVDLVACLAVNDDWVMKCWAEAHGAFGKITMLADGSGNFTKALGIETDIPGMGLRARRGLIVFENGVVTSIELEGPSKFEVSSAEACIAKLAK